MHLFNRNVLTVTQEMAALNGPFLSTEKKVKFLDEELITYHQPSCCSSCFSCWGGPLQKP